MGEGGGQGQKQEQDSNACFSDVVLSFHFLGSSLIFFDVRLGVAGFCCWYIVRELELEIK